MLRLLIIFLFIGSLAAADPRRDSPKPVVSKSRSEPQPVATATLPKLLQDALLGAEWIIEIEKSIYNNIPDVVKLPDTLSVAKIDLNRDGSPEYIVSSNQPFSGGPMQMIFERQKSRYACIGEFQGDFHLAATVNGYYQICGNSRGGGGFYTAFVMRYSRGEYRNHEVTQFRLLPPDGSTVEIIEKETHNP